MSDLYGPLEELEDHIEKNLSQITSLSDLWKKKRDDPEAFFKAWKLIRETADLIEELEQVYSRYKGQQIIN